MPGIIQASTTAVVLPQFLCAVFTQDREYLANVNTYQDGTSQRELIVFNSRRKWSLQPKVSRAAMVTLRNFYRARRGGTDPFWLYDYQEGPVKNNYDATGADPNGRFLVRFDGKWEQSISLNPFGTATIQLVELIEGLGAGSDTAVFDNPNPGSLLFPIF